ncbi:MAG: SRPBCC domain-containing protein [Moraxellaceae bacterium]|nr:SRPBCC domain-containing protein [Moraxellaceae bacterium]
MIAAVLGGAQARPDDTLSITREFDAPRHLVFAAWTEARHQFRWMGPKDFTVLDCQIDLRVGGRYRTCIRSPDGQEYWFRGEYREIDAPARLVFTFAWEEEGERGMENLVSLSFSEQGGRTRMHFVQTPFQSVSERDSHMGGWTEAFDRLGDFIGGRR